MFEAIMLLCISETGICGEVLLPGYERTSEAACLEASAEYVGSVEIRCASVGKAAAFQEAAPGVFVHRGQIAVPDPDNLGDVANIGFVVGADSVAVIDSGGSRQIGEQVWRAIRTRTALPVSHVILTHMHPDHVLGASVFADAGAAVIGHSGLARAVADREANYLESFDDLVGAEEMHGTRAVAPDIEIDQALTLDLGGRLLDLHAWPSAHTGTDVTVFDRETGIVFTGDLAFHDHTPALDGSVKGWRAVLGKIAADARISAIVPGHGGPILPFPDGLDATARYLEVLETETRAAIEDGLSLGEAAESIALGEAGAWQLFEEYNARNATVAYTELEWE